MGIGGWILYLVGLVACGPFVALMFFWFVNGLLWWMLHLIGLESPGWLSYISAVGGIILAGLAILGVVMALLEKTKTT